MSNFIGGDLFFLKKKEGVSRHRPAARGVMAGPLSSGDTMFPQRATVAARGRGE